MADTIPEAERYLNKQDVGARYRLHPATLLRKVGGPEDFPAPVYIGGQARWRLSDLIAWEARAVGSKPPARTRNLRNQPAGGTT